MADLGELVLRMKLDSTEYKRDLLRMRELTNQFNRDFDRQTGTALGPINTRGAERSLRGFGANAQTIITGAFLNIGARISNILLDAVGSLASIPGRAVSSFLSFEGGLNQLAVVTNQTRDELSGVTDVIKQLGIETSKAPAEVVAAANALATLGQTSVQIETNLPAVVALSEATRTDLELSAELIAKVGTVFGTSASLAADAITTLRNTSAALPQDVTFLLQQAGAVGAASNTSFSDLAATFATLRDAGINARPAATGLRNILQNLNPVSDKATEALQELNLQLIDTATGNFAGFEEFIRQIQASRQSFIDSGAGLAAFNRNLQVLFGREGVVAVTSLLEQADGAFAKNVQNLQAFSGAASESAQGLQTGFAGALTLLSGTVDTLLISLGEGLAPVLEGFARILTTVGNSLLQTDGLFDGLVVAAEGLRDAISGNPEAIQELAQAFVSLAGSGIQAVASFFNALAADPDLVASTFAGAASAVSAFAQVINITVGLIGTFGAIVGGLSGFFETANRIIRAVVGAIELFGVAVTFINPPLGLFILAITNIGDIFRFIRNPIQTITGLFQGFANVIQGAIDRLQAFLGITKEVQAISLDNVGQAGALALVGAGERLIARRHGGAVGPGDSFLVGEAPKVGPELGVFGGKAALFTQPTILRSPPSGNIFSPEKTRQLLGGAKTTQLGESHLVSEIRQLREQVGQVREIMPMVEALIKNLASSNSEIGQDLLFERARYRLRGQI